ncbi:MAG TPA: serine hydrolase domain-containing protein [Mycobacteriales bacterium]|nr:serine hydrolase domain-containing protein [Mycobacteriales bacterium]
MGALDAVAGWPVGSAAAAVIGPDAVLDTYGDVDRAYPLASVTKPLVALACLVAVEEGALGLDDPAGPDGSTVRHLLSHASGLAPDSRDVVARPGARRIYSNSGFEVLGEHMRQATGIAVPDYLDEAVCEPLGLRSTELAGSPAHAASASVADLAAVAAELLTSAKLLHPSTVARLATVQFPGLSGVVPGFGRQPTNDWGLGVEIRDRKAPHWTGTRNHPATFGHFGRSGTFLWVDPVARLACVVLTDTEFEQWAKDAWPPLADAVLAEHTESQPE